MISKCVRRCVRKIFMRSNTCLQSRQDYVRVFQIRCGRRRVTLCVQAASPSPWSKSLYQQLDCGYVITYIYTGHNPSVSWSVYFSSFCILTVTDLVNRATVCMHTVWWRSPSHDTASVAGCLNSQFTRVTAQWNKAALLIEDQSC